MESNKYLPVGTNIGGHYEIIDVLGDDDFEILYLVRDNHRKGSFFVLKELFLETFSSRKNTSVSTMPEAEGVFDKRKREIIAELNMPKRSINRDEVRTYGYLEDNNTIYTIMEFTNNFDIKSYLHFHPRDEIILPPLVEAGETKRKEKKSFLFLKILIVTVLIGLGLGFYAYKMLKEDKEKESKTNVVVTQTAIHHPDLTSRDQQPTKEEPKNEPKEVKEKVVPEGAEYISVSDIKEKKKETINETPIDSVIAEDKVYIDNEVEEIPNTPPKSTDKVVVENSLPKSSIEEEVTPPKIEYTPKIVEHSSPSNHISLGTKIESVPNQNSSLGTPIGAKSSHNDFSKSSVQHFLNEFIASSATGSVDDIASKYDYHVDRYFSLRDVTHTVIKKDKRRYNRRWTHREFTIKDFHIVRRYKKDGTDYCDIKTTTKWRVSTNSGKRASGTSRGFMTIKKTNSGFKVKSIYTLK